MTTSDDETGCILGVVIVLGLVAATVVALVFAVGWTSPSVVSGDVPEVSHPTDCDAQGRCAPNARVATLTWTIGPGAHADTTLASLDDGQETVTREIDGSLELDDPDECPGAVVAWTLTPQRAPARAGSPLRAAASVSPGDLAPPAEGARELHLALRRLDREGCTAAVAWRSASFK